MKRSDMSQQPDDKFDLIMALGIQRPMTQCRAQDLILVAGNLGEANKNT